VVDGLPQGLSDTNKLMVRQWKSMYLQSGVATICTGLTTAFIVFEAVTRRQFHVGHLVSALYGVMVGTAIVMYLKQLEVYLALRRRGVL